MSINQPNFPNKIWDGSSPSRHDRTIDRPPDGEDWDQIVAELIALQQNQNIATNWIPLVFTNWVNYGPPYEVGRYRKIGNTVHLSGTTYNNTGLGFINGVIATVEVGYRPLNTAIFYKLAVDNVDNTYHNCTVEVRTNGDIYVSFEDPVTEPILAMEGMNYNVD